MTVPEILGTLALVAGAATAASKHYRRVVRTFFVPAGKHRGPRAGRSVAA